VVSVREWLTKSRAANLSAIAPAAAAAGRRIVAAAHDAVAAGSGGAGGCGGDATSGRRLIALIAQILVRLVTRGGWRQ